jgi:hypothetical protein
MKTSIPVTEYTNFIKTGEISLQEALSKIRNGCFKTEVEELRTLLYQGSKDQYDERKKELLAFTVQGTFKNKRDSEHIKDYNKLIILDIDKIDTDQIDVLKQKASLDTHTYACFKSPSNQGLKIIVPVNSNKENHKEAFEQVAKFYEKSLKVEIDSSGKDVSRLCFYSYDPDLKINENVEVFSVEVSKEVQYVDKEIIHEVKYNSQSNIEDYILEIEQTTTDITGDYETWRNLGFAISEEYGETGRDYFHRISRFHPKYNYQECNKQFSSCLEAKGSGISVSTFYYKAHQHNIKPFANSFEESNATLINDVKETNTDSPTFSDSLIPQLPQFLQDVVKHATTSQEKDIMILGAITSISACLPKIYGIYDGDKVYSNLFLFVTAAAASGKGKIKFCKRVVYKIHKELREEAILMEAEHETELAQYNKNKAKDESLKKPQRPPVKMLLIPANNSSTGMFQLLHDSKGKGLIFETEADTLAKNFKTDYGDYSDGFRNAFHHEPIKYYRRTDREYVEIERPCLSCVLTGTPKQVLALMPNAENGLFSRFMFYHMPSTTKWRNVFAINTKNGLNEYFDELGNQFYELYRELNRETEIKFDYTDEQKEKFLEFFPKLNLYYLNINSIEYDGSVKRMGTIAFRISMILTTLRILETGEVSDTIYCSNEDYESTITIVKALIKHSSKVYSSLPVDKTAVKYKNKKEQFIDSLPLHFTTQQFQKKAKKLEITSKTAERYITDLCKSNVLVRESQGNYYNPNKEEVKGDEGTEEI